MHARRLLTPVVIATLLPLTACDGGEILSSGSAGQNNVDWVAVAGRDLNCDERGARLIGGRRQRRRGSI